MSTYNKKKPFRASRKDVYFAKAFSSRCPLLYVIARQVKNKRRPELSLCRCNLTRLTAILAHLVPLFAKHLREDACPLPVFLFLVLLDAQPLPCFLKQSLSGAYPLPVFLFLVLSGAHPLLYFFNLTLLDAHPLPYFFNLTLLDAHPLPVFLILALLFSFSGQGKGLFLATFPRKSGLITPWFPIGFHHSAMGACPPPFYKARHIRAKEDKTRTGGCQNKIFRRQLGYVDVLTIS